MNCTCEHAHVPTCPGFLAGVDPNAPVPHEARHRTVFDNRLRDAVTRGADRFGREKMHDVLMDWALTKEGELRAKLPPDHEVLRALEDYRRRKSG